MTEIVIRPTGIAQVLATLEVGETLLDDLTPLMRQVSGILGNIAEDAFDHEKSPDGKPWQPLAESTARKLIAGKGRGQHPMLQVTGRLVASLNTESGRDYSQIGTNVVYAAIQQLGGLAGRATPSAKARRDRPFRRPRIPARAYIGVGDAGGAMIEKAAATYIAKKLGG